MSRCLILLIAAALSACATTAGYEKILNTWIGSQEIDLVRSWGPPQQTYEVGGRRFLVYSSRRTVYLPGTAPTYQTTIVGNTAYTNAIGGSPGMAVDKTCITIFELEGTRIVSWSHKGNDCKARE